MSINKPISAFLATLLIIIFLLLFTNILKVNSCDKDFTTNIISNFLHIDLLHLLSNLYGLYVLSRIEQKLGSTKFIIIISLIVIINTIIETVAHKIINLPCSIGFSAILYGLLAWELVSKNSDFDYQILVAVLIDIFIAISVKNNKIAIANHFMGMISGIILGLFLQYKD